MRKKLSEDTKRNKIIGIKVQSITRDKLNYIATREDSTISSITNELLVKYIEDYFRIAKIDWEQLTPEEKRGKE